MRDPSDPKFREGVFEIENALDVLLGQIRMILFTRPGDVIGRLGFGIDLEREVFSMSTSNSSIESLVSKAIYEHCPDASDFNVRVKASFFYGSSRDICLIDIFVDEFKIMGIVLK